MRTLFAVVALALVVAACQDASTSPTAAPSLDLANETLYCPAPFTSQLTKLDPPHEADHNLDGLVCRLEILDEKETIVLTFVDNNVPVQLGTCPNGFEVVVVTVSKEGEPTVDRNGDSFACQATRPNGNVVVIDNRFEVEKGGEIPKETK